MASFQPHIPPWIYLETAYTVESWLLNAVIEFANKIQKVKYLAVSSFVTMDDGHIEESMKE